MLKSLNPLAALALLTPMAGHPILSHAEPNFRVMLAKSYDQQTVAGWLASEKLDGVRAYWNGENLLSRRGNIFTAPNGFADEFPDFDLDGELYIGRGRFADTSGKVRRGEDWSDIKYHVFDVPNAEGGLLSRLAVLEKWLQQNPNPHIVIVKQTPIQHIAEAQQLRKDIEKAGGEGVMLRSPNAGYLPMRTETLLKLKSVQDAECEVIGHTAGKGKYRGKLGALVCRLADGRQIKIGSGLSDAERSNPPAIGSVITYRYNGLTKTGKPRFARFWRMRRPAPAIAAEKAREKE